MSKYKTFGDCVYDPAKRTLYLGDTSTVLEPRIDELLNELCSSIGPKSRTDLLDRIWGPLGSDEALTQAISRLRRAIGDTKRPYQIIKTVPRGGYEIGIPVGGTDKIPAPMEMPTTAQETKSSGIASKIKQHISFIIGFVSGATALLIVWAVIASLNPPQQINEDITCFAGSTNPECLRPQD